MLLLSLAALGLAADPAVPELNAQLFHMSLDGRVGFGLDDAQVHADRSPHAKVALHYVNDPLVYAYEDGERVAVLSDLFAVDVMGGWTVGRLRVGVDLPLYLAAMGDLSGGGTVLGDMGLDVKAVALDPSVAPIGLAGVARVLLPTGSAAVPVGAPGLGVEAGLVASKEIDDWRLAANLTTRQIPETALGTQSWGSHLAFRAGAARAIGERAGASVELSGAKAYGTSGIGSAPLEAMVGGWYAPEPSVIARLGAGTGLTDGVGAPLARVIASISFEPGANPDRDRDRIVDRVDACKDVPEDADGWEDVDGCPDPDDDRDGVADVNDACRRSPEDGDGWEDDDGCPDPDDDRDNVADAADACPRDPEDADQWRDEDGCPEPTEVRVRFVDAAGKLVPNVKASMAGVYGGAEIAGALAKGSYGLDAEAPGYLAYTGDLVVPEGPPIELTRQMEAEPNAGTLQVQVTNAEGKPLDAIYRLDAGAPGTLAGGTSLFSLPPGRHTVHVTAEGHASASVPTVITKGRTTTVAIVMQPAKVVVKKEALEILDKIYFDTNKTSIRRQSYALLDEIANVLRDHPEIARVSVEGHTDSRGNDAFNLKLSDGRAKAVAAYLQKKGIPAERLLYKGFGEAMPVDPAETEAAWDKNRRVEFRIVDRSDD